jgi:outer membrane protein assembly factor BamA
MKKSVFTTLALSLPLLAQAGQSYMPIVGFTDKTGLMYGAAAFYYQDGRPGFELGCYGVTNALNFNSITLEGQKRGADGTDMAGKVVLSKTFDNYFGEGDDTSADLGLRLSENTASAELSLLKPALAGWSLGPVLGLKTREETGLENLKRGGALPGRAFADSASPALGLRALNDSRDSCLSSTSGRLLQLDLRAIPQVLAFEAGAHDAWQAQAEWREFTRLAPSLVLAQRLEGGFSLGDPGYAERYALGGTELMRGFGDNRFRGRQFYCLQEELRFPIWREIGAAVSGDFGDASDGALSHPRASAQAGLRIGLPPGYGMKARLDFGFSDSGDQSMALQFGQTF